MKKQTIAIMSAFAAAQTLAATPTLNWSIPTSSIIQNITFAITINQAAPVDEFYFAN
jgi:hypothetical protein